MGAAHARPALLEMRGRKSRLLSAMTVRRKQGRSKDEIARLDARWFKAHPERRYRVRQADQDEVQLPGLPGDRPVLMAMRWTGRGCIYQPLFYDAGPPRLERLARILFAIAASKRDPVPIVRVEDALALARRLTSAKALAC
jgi:hypothetical protein